MRPLRPSSVRGAVFHFLPLRARDCGDVEAAVSSCGYCQLWVSCSGLWAHTASLPAHSRTTFLIITLSSDGPLLGASLLLDHLLTLYVFQTFPPFASPKSIFWTKSLRVETFGAALILDFSLSSHFLSKMQKLVFAWTPSSGPSVSLKKKHNLCVACIFIIWILIGSAFLLQETVSHLLIYNGLRIVHQFGEFLENNTFYYSLNGFKFRKMYYDFTALAVKSLWIKMSLPDNFWNTTIGSEELD